MKIPNAEGLSASLEDYIVAIFHLEQPGCVAGPRTSPIT